MKKAVKLFVISLILLLCTGISCFAQEKVEVSDENQLMDVLINGGYAVLQDYVSFDSDEDIIVNHDAVIDLNGYSLIIGGKDYSVNADLCFINGRANLYGNSLSVSHGTMAVKKGLLNLSELNCRIGPEAYLLEADSDAHITVSSKQSAIAIAELNVDSIYITDDMFTEIAKTGNLPELVRDGYTFDGWKDRSGKTVNTWRGGTGSNRISASWAENTATVMGAGGIWKILTFVFFLSTVVMAVLYARKR